MNQILVLHEKHAARYFDASTEENLHNAALFILKERLSGEYACICHPGTPEEWGIKEEDNLTDAQIEALPEQFRNQARANRKRHRTEITRYNREVQMFNAAEEALKAHDGKRAFTILVERSYREYEGLNLESLEEV